jgi:hypothetical protein
MFSDAVIDKMREDLDEFEQMKRLRDSLLELAIQNGDQELINKLTPKPISKEEMQKNFDSVLSELEQMKNNE